MHLDELQEKLRRVRALIEFAIEADPWNRELLEEADVLVLDVIAQVERERTGGA